MMDTYQHFNIKTQIEGYFKLSDNDDDNNNMESIYNLCWQLKNDSMLFLGLYHYHALVDQDHGSLIHDWRDVRDRSRLALNIFRSLAISPTETIETYYSWYMIGQCYQLGSGVKVDANEACEWFKKAADKKIPIAYSGLGSLYRHNDMFEQAVESYEIAFKYGLVGAAKALFQLYATAPSIKDFNKAYDWATKSNITDFESRYLLNAILATGHFDWTPKTHRYWSHLRMEFLVKTVMCDRTSLTVLHHITFTDQVFVILLISKFRTQSQFKFANFLTKDIGISIIRQLARVWNLT